MDRSVENKELVSTIALLQEKIEHEATRALLCQTRATYMQEQVASLMTTFRKEHGIDAATEIVLDGNATFRWKVDDDPGTSSSA